MSRSYKNNKKEYKFYKDYDYDCRRNAGYTYKSSNKIKYSGERKRKRKYREVRERIERIYNGSLLSNAILFRIRGYDMYW